MELKSSSILLPPVSIPNTTKWTPTIQSARKTLLTLLPLTANMDGKSSSVSRLYFSYMRNYGIEVHVARFHNIFGPEGTWKGGREKRPPRSAEKLPKRPAAGRLKFGEMVSK